MKDPLESKDVFEAWGRGGRREGEGRKGRGRGEGGMGEGENGGRGEWGKGGMGEGGNGGRGEWGGVDVSPPGISRATPHPQFIFII